MKKAVSEGQISKAELEAAIGSTNRGPLLTAAEGTVLGVEDLAQFGIDPAEASAMQRILDKYAEYDPIADVRPATPGSEDLRGAGFPPKPETIKTKTPGLYGNDPSVGGLYTSDLDMYRLSRSDGTPLPPEIAQALLDELKASRFKAQHGALRNWPHDNPATYAKDTQIFDDIVARHQPGGEALVRFAPNSPPKVQYD